MVEKEVEREGELKVLEKLLHASDARKSPGKGEEKTEPEKRATHFCVRGQEEMRQRRRKCCHMFFLCHFRFLFLFIFISPHPNFPGFSPFSEHTKTVNAAVVRLCFLIRQLPSCCFSTRSIS